MRVLVRVDNNYLLLVLAIYFTVRHMITTQIKDSVYISMKISRTNISVVIAMYGKSMYYCIVEIIKVCTFPQKIIDRNLSYSIGPYSALIGLD